MTEPPPPPGYGYSPDSPYPHYPAQYPGHFPAPYQAPPSQAMAIVALILAFIPLGITWVVAIVLAVVVLVRARSGRAAGTGMAIGAIVVSVVSMVVVTLVVVLVVNEVTKYDDARAAGSGTIWVDMLREGDCLDGLPLDDVVGEVDIVPCAQPHEGEVYAVFDIDAGSRPSQDYIDQLAEEGCDIRFEEFVGTGFPDSELDGDLIRPTPEDIKYDDHEVICYLSDPDGLTTGSLEGSNR